MVKRPQTPLVPLLALLFALSGCSGASLSFARDMASVLTGTLAWGSGDLPGAAAAFLDALSAAEASGNGAVRDYALYGLASVYLGDDEREAALSRLDEIGDGASAEIGSSSWYQRGVIAFRSGDYEGAAKSFRRSMEIGGAAADARINMELSLRSRDEARSSSSSVPSASQIERSEDPASEALLSLVRKKERDRWKNQESDGAEASGLDY